MNNPTHIVVHHTAVSYDKNPDQFDATNNYHRSKNFPISSLGFYNGYHYEIAKDGTVRQARLHTDVGAHCYQEEMNYRSIGVCLDGNFDAELPTDKQMESLSTLIERLQDELHIEDSNVNPHRAYAPKTCWGNLLPDNVIEYITERVGIREVSSWAKEAVDWCMDPSNSVTDTAIITKIDNPKEITPPQHIEIMLQRAGIISEVEGKGLSKERWAVVIKKISDLMNS